jgi:2-polyprenyl-6-hydroxyphenyl methylase/3-demethylubiquinone-9 3-methyltransferase
MARAAELDVREITGLTYNPFTKVYALAPDTDVNYMMHCTREA